MNSPSRHLNYACRTAAGGLLEHHHGAQHLTGGHRAEGLVDFIELDAARYHVVEVEPPLQVEIDIGGDVDTEAVGSHLAAGQLLLLEQVVPLDLDRIGGRHHPDA